MTSFIIKTLCIFITVVQCTEGCLYFETSPTMIDVGFTKSISINCTFRYTGSSAITNVTQITIVKSVRGVLDEIASIKRPLDDVDKSLNVHRCTDGFFDREDVSALSVRWRGPVPDDAGKYICTVKGVDNSGLPHEITETLSLAYNVSEELCRMDLITRKQSLTFFFYPPARYAGSNYYLSRILANSSQAESICQEYGGYLMEVDDDEEMQVANQLTYKHNVYSLIAGTDAGQEGTWIFPRSGRPVNVFYWEDNEPNDSYNGEDCREVRISERKPKVNDISCDWYLSFICEINEAMFKK
ncbi:hypothetical protein Btru_030128 [Bulinus truncatus]|nr:hypothetical protein Btru_030128 [Bulinus truncatus]